MISLLGCVCVCVCVCLCSVASFVSDSVTLWTVACQAPLSLGFSRQEYWSGLPDPPPGDLSDTVIGLASPASPTLQVDSLPLRHQGSRISLSTLYQNHAVQLLSLCKLVLLSDKANPLHFILRSIFNYSSPLCFIYILKSSCQVS